MLSDLTKTRFARLIDHTALKPDTTRRDVERLCRETLEFGFLTSCVAPVWVPLAVSLLERSPSGVAAVVGFPHGTSVSSVKAREAGEALDAGAREVDMVAAIGMLKGGDPDAVRRDIAAVVGAARRHPGAVVKVILETALLEREEKILGCRLAEEAGAGFVKTSTGFGSGGATIDDVRLISGAVGGRLGVKAAGGIRSLEFALALLDAGATRLGCSSSVALMGEWES